MDRTRLLRRVASERFDLLVIGGGITGVGVAREAALASLNVAVFDRADFASGTSSRSTKLIHGGLRYLRNYELRLVHESVVERQRMLRMAPHLVHPLRFVFPVYQGDPDGLAKLRLGLLLYDAFAGRSNRIRHRILDAADLLALEPLLNPHQLVGGGVYTDSATDDARLVIEVLQSAVSYGAVAANYVEVEALLHDPRGTICGARVRDHLSDEVFEVQAARVLNATGPWADHVRRLEDPGAQPLLRLTKGVHISLPRDRLPVRHAVTMRGEDGRIMFAVPSWAFTYVGTTDTDFPSADPAALRIEREDVDYLLRAISRNFPETDVDPDDVVGAWAGLRPLIASDAADPSATSRDYKLYPGPDGMLTVAGGKLTAFRAMASHIVDVLFPHAHRRQRQAQSLAPLPGATTFAPPTSLLEQLAAETGEPRPEVERVAARYGRFFDDVLRRYARARAAQPPALAWRLAQLERAVEVEMAVQLQDVLRRRTTLQLFSSDNGMHGVHVLAEHMGRQLGWTTAEIEAQVAAAHDAQRRMHAWRQDVRAEPVAIRG